MIIDSINYKDFFIIFLLYKLNLFILIIRNNNGIRFIELNKYYISIKINFI